MNIDKQLETVLVTFCDLVVANRRRYDETGKDDYIAILDEAKSTLKKLIDEVRIDELDKVMTGVNTAAGIRTPAACARNLNIDDLQYYLYNRRRVISGQNAHSPEEWFEEVR